MNRLTTAQMDSPIDRAVYTQLLNPRGGIEMDVTITRLNDTAFHLTSGAATRARDLSFLRRNLPHHVKITDMTDHYCTIGVMGAASGEILMTLNPDDYWNAIPQGMVFTDRFAGWKCRATRMSFVGEYGWELMVPNAGATALYEALREAGAKPMGHFALEGCRLEKGFKHWGHELGPWVTPLEAGLGFTIDWHKEFTGKTALEAQRASGLCQRLVLMQIEGDALMLHDEPVYEAGRHVGLTTSGGRGPRTGLNLCFAIVQTQPRETLAETCSRSFAVRVAGRDYPAIPLRRPPFDPKGERMRA